MDCKGATRMLVVAAFLALVTLLLLDSLSRFLRREVVLVGYS